MSSLGFIVALLSLTGAGNATLMPIETDFHPIGNKAVTVFLSLFSAGLERSRSAACNHLLLWRQMCHRESCSVFNPSGGKWSNVVNTRSNWCSDLPSVATAPLRSQWFGTRNNTGHRPWW